MSAAAQLPNQREDNFAHGDGVFAGLNVDVRDGGGPMVDEQLENLIGGEAETIKRVVIAAHRAIVAVLAAIARNFDDTAHEDPATEDGIPQFSRRLME